MKIWKYPLLTHEAHPTIEMPFGAEILTVQLQNGKPYIWALVNTHGLPRKYRFKVVGTGEEVTASGSYVGTFQDGPFVWHVFQDGISK